MKALSEVCKIVGVTRKMLRGYDEMGLLHPAMKTDAGYWLYDDFAISKLKLIQVFTEAGYSRKEIKYYFESPDVDLKKVLASTREALVEKKKTIEGMIKAIKLLEKSLDLPESTLNVLARTDFQTHEEGKSYIENLRESISILGNMEEEDATIYEEMTMLTEQIILLGLEKDGDVGSDSVREKTIKLIRCLVDFWRMDIHEDCVKNEVELSIAKQAAIASVILKFMLAEGMGSQIEERIGQDATAFVFKAIEAYGRQQCTGEDFELLLSKTEEELKNGEL